MIQNLVDALNLSPDNVPLRLQVAHLMMNEKMYAEAVEQLSEVLKRSYGHTTAQQQLAECFYYLGKYSAAIITYEQLEFEQLPVQSAAFFIRSLIKEHSIEQAMELYRQLLVHHPQFADEEIDKVLRLGTSTEMDDEFPFDDSDYFLEKPTTKFSDVGGMKNVKNEISLKIIQPLKNPDLYKAFGKKAGGGILLYGPPGCGKTFIAKATAGEIDAKFISIGLHDILDMWIGNSEKNLHQVFEVARANKPCVLFFDEVDALGSSRADLKQSAMRHVINQFLAELDGVDADNEGILILAATNAPWSVDGAFRRPGRFDRIIFVAPPDEEARVDILQQLLKEKPVAEIDVKKIAAQSDGYSGADLTALIDIAVEDKLAHSIETGELQPITTKDLLRALKVHKPTTQEWFSSARNYALYANESGLYDEILKYLKIKR
ncbi:tetratricopeptide repeat protein [Lacibacter luteus]|uniref:Tetratricopeptide repeat protein n=2 Tax=Lacibacter luteus TaxID=2508719 RepID=A0A4Q1CQ46_9BACT|nr:tetratricopeptide repeat protein [Lacibacter luteus]